MFHVNSKTVTAGLITVLIGSQAFAQAVRPRERVREETRAREAVQQAPSTRAGDAIVEGFKTAPGARPAVPPVSFIDEKGNTCNAEAYSTKLSNGTSVSYASTLALVKAGWVKMGTCGSEEGGLLGYTADARETLLLAMQSVSNSVNGRPASQLSTTERVQAKIALREGLAAAKNRNGGNKYTAATETATADKIMADEAHGGCSLIPTL